MLKPPSLTARLVDHAGVVAAILTILFAILCAYALFGLLSVAPRPAGKFSLRIGSGIGVPLSPGRVAQVRP